ncbi:MAG: EAL domain-containing protein [Arcobacteraceae bacterium]|nr:EAL domain-containing protein [Arcobacteraceae bacterium]
MFEKIKKLHKYTQGVQALYVEDDSIAREHTAEFLGTIFENLIVAIDGEDGLNKFQNNTIDMVITDINMPKLNGIEMLEKIKAIDKNCHIIILSQHNEVDILLQSIELNVDGYILKPLDFEKLLDTIEKVVEKLKFEDEAKNHKYYLEQYLSLLDKSGIISKTDRQGTITYVNDSFCKISGYTKEELIGEKHNITRHHENTNEIYEQMWHTINNREEPWEGVVKNRSKSGSSYYVRTIITPIKNTQGEVVEYVAVRDNLNAVIDDKKYLFEQIEQNGLSILVLLQIDEFDMLEKFYNTLIVDQVEKTFAINLLSYLPKEYTFENVYSLGNGRFALLTEFNTFETTKLNIQEYLTRFVDNVKNSNLIVDNMELDIHITVSYAAGQYLLYEDAKEGLENAIQAKTKVSFSNDSSIIATKEAKDNLEMIKTVKIALDKNNIVSYFQPIINNKTRKIEKYESLVRLIDENGNILSPFAFLNISKKGNYHSKITQRVLQNSFKILHTINTKLSINISASDIEKEQTRTQIFTLLEQYKDDAHRIIFELLEDENVKDFEIVKQFIAKVKSKGVQIAIDDFGTGYSNFERILEFDPNIIKIDGSLIRNIAHDQFSRNIVETIVLFAKKQNIETIAEYVENESIFNILNEIGVDYSQGYYFGKPNVIKEKYYSISQKNL